MNRNTTDIHYRYKMPSVKITNAGRGIGTFTIIDNLEDIAKSINHPAEVLLKFLGIAIGAAVNFEKKSINGTHTEKVVQDNIFNYIELFCFCSICKIPEVTPYLNKISKKNVQIKLKCTSCGGDSVVVSSKKFADKAIDMIIKELEKGWIKNNNGNVDSSDFLI